jgi:hypothetical protein
MIARHLTSRQRGRGRTTDDRPTAEDDDEQRADAGEDGEEGEDEGEGESKTETTETKAAQSADRLKGMLERIMGSKLGQLSKTLMEELRPEIETMFPDLNMDDDACKTDVFKLLMKNPGKMISLIKKAKTRMEDKFKRGEISREELMEDMTEMMKDNEMKKEMEAMMRQMMGGKGRMNPNAMRAEMAKHAQRNRMRQKRDQKQQSTFFGGASAAVGTAAAAGTATTGTAAVRTGTVVGEIPVEYFRVDNDTEIRTSKRPQTEEEIAAIIAELEKDRAKEAKRQQQQQANHKKPGKKGKR